MPALPEVVHRMVLGCPVFAASHLGVVDNRAGLFNVVELLKRKGIAEEIGDRGNYFPENFWIR